MTKVFGGATAVSPMLAQMARRSSGAVGNTLSGTNLERAGDYNQRVVLQAIRIHGPITRAELARVTGLTAPAIANIARRLIQLDLIAEAGKRHGYRGQPATKLVIHDDGCCALGVNIDRDHMTLVMLDLRGRVRGRFSVEGPLDDPATTAANIAGLVRTVLAQAGPIGVRLDTRRLIGVGVAIPDALAQTELPTHAIHRGWADLDVAELVAGAVHDAIGVRLPVLVENDAAAAARGELQFGLGLQYDSFFYVLISAGLGGGLVMDGEYFRGANGRSGEIGFLPIRSPLTTARSLQEAVSLSALFADLERRGASVRSPSELTQLNAAGAAGVEAWLALATDLLIDPLLAVSWLVNPAAILLGGRLPAPMLDDLARRLTATLRQRAPDAPVLAPVQRAATAEDAPAVGAAILPFLADLLPSRSSLMKRQL